MNILVAEDDPITRGILEETFENWGYEVSSYSDGAEAWEALQEEDAPEIVVVDWIMPGMDGPEICRRVRESSTSNSPYIILLTAKERKEEIIEGLQSGADDYIVKPFDLNELIARVHVGQRVIQLQKETLKRETAYYVRQLEFTVAELRESRSRVVAAQETVRKAIAEELHGRVQTEMAMIYFSLQDIQSDVAQHSNEAAEKIGQIAGELDTLRENDIRQISHRLHPRTIQFGLAACLRSLKDSFERSLPVELEISQDVLDLEPPGESGIPFNTRLGLHRVTEELLGNVIKHANASKVFVTISTSDDRRKLHLKVRDNGIGFDPSARRNGLGLVTIADYLGVIDGSFEIESSSGNGAIITATVPLELGASKTNSP